MDTIQEINTEQLKEAWKVLQVKFAAQFDEELDLETILFLIGVQELGKGPQNFTKDQKVDLMHIAICKLLSTHGYYKFEDTDDEGWPHYKIISTLPPLSNAHQDMLLKSEIVKYFENIGY